MTPKAKWEEVREVIEKEAGPIRCVQQISEGYNSEVSVIVHTDDGATFVKGRQADHPRVWTQKIEREINPAVQPVSARIKWSVQSDVWDLNGFEPLPGTKADYSPGSADLPKVVDMLRRVQEIPCPAAEVKQAEHRWRHYTDKPDLLAGAGLLHTEWTPGNVLIGECAYLVDWAWATKGALWIDPACWVVWLIAGKYSEFV